MKGDQEKFIGSTDVCLNSILIYLSNPGHIKGGTYRLCSYRYGVVTGVGVRSSW